MKHHKIWIELEKSEKAEENYQACLLANQMLHRLSIERNCFFYNEKKRCFCYEATFDSGYVELKENGVWLNLNYLSGMKMDNASQVVNHAS